MLIYKIGDVVWFVYRSSYNEDKFVQGTIIGLHIEDSVYSIEFKIDDIVKQEFVQELDIRHYKGCDLDIKLINEFENVVYDHSFIYNYL